jgi:hypothetical protein
LTTSFTIAPLLIHEDHSKPFVLKTDVFDFAVGAMKVLKHYKGQHSTLRVMFMWNIHDFLAYKLFSGYVLTCGPTTDSQSSRKLKKVIYCGSHHYMPIIHPYWLVWSDFNEKIENKFSPIQVSASNTIKWDMEQKTWLQGLRNRLGAKRDLVYKHGIKWHNIMFKLPYWEISVASQNCKI